MIIDFSNLCNHRQKITRSLALNQLQRINKIFPSQSQSIVNIEIFGEEDKTGYDVVNVNVSATLLMTCQRCLNDFPYLINSSRRYFLADARHDKTPSTVENMELLEKDKIDIKEFISDEILLSLPISVMHDANKCPSKKYTNL